MEQIADKTVAASDSIVSVREYRLRPVKALTLSKPPLETDALAALTQVQRAVKHLMRSLPGPFERPSQLQHCLGIESKVAWNFFKLATAKDPLAAAAYVPGLLLMRRIGQAALRKGVPESVVKSVLVAIAEFDVIVKRHASTRTAFKAIIASVAGDEPAEAMALQQRHTAFNADSQLWGKCIDLHFTQAIFTRRNDFNTSTSLITVKSGLQLLRSDASTMVEGYISSDGTGKKVQPLDPNAAGNYGCSLLPPFCSQPMPQFKTEHRDDGWQNSIVQNNSIGRRGAVDLAFGRYVESDAIGHLRNGDPIVIHGTHFSTPTAAGLLEFMVHRPSFPNAEPQFAVFAEPVLTTMENLIDYGQQFPQIGSLQKIGSAATATTSPHECLPRYEEMQNYVFSKLGWDRSEFDLYRVSLSYPILHTIGAIWFKL